MEISRRLCVPSLDIESDHNKHLIEYYLILFES